MKHRCRRHLRALDLLMLSGAPLSARFETAGEGGAGGGGAGGQAGAGGDKGAGDKGATPDPRIAELETIKASLTERETALASLTTQIAELKKSNPSAAEKAELETLRAQKKKAEEDKLKEEGQFKELLRLKDKEYGETIAGITSERDSFKTKYHTTRVNTILFTEIPKHTSVPADAVANALFQGTIVVDPETDSVVVRVPDGAGGLKTPKNSEGQPMTPAQYIMDTIAKTEWLKAHKAKGGSGGGSQDGGGSGGPGGSKVFTREQIANMTPAQYKENKPAIMAQVEANRRSLQTAGA